MSYSITVKISGGIPPEVKLYGDVPIGTFTIELNEGEQQTRFIARHRADGRCVSIAHDEYDRAERAQHEAEIEAENRASWERRKAKWRTPAEIHEQDERTGDGCSLCGPDDPGVGVVELTREQGRAMLDERTRRELGMTLEEFEAAYDAGGLADIPEAEHLAMLLPFARDMKPG